MKEKYWLVYSNYDLSQYPVKAILEDYYVVSDKVLEYLLEKNLPLTVIDEVNLSDFKKFANKYYQLELNKKYKDTFTIFHFPEIKLVSQTKHLYKFKYKSYEIIVRKSLCRGLEQ